MNFCILVAQIKLIWFVQTLSKQAGEEKNYNMRSLQTFLWLKSRHSWAFSEESRAK